MNVKSIDHHQLMLKRYTVEPLKCWSLQPFNPSTFQHFNPSTLQHFNPSTLQPFNPSTFQHFNPSTFQPFNASTLQRFNIFNFFKKLLALILILLTTGALKTISAQDGQLNTSQQFRLGERYIRVAEPGQLVDSVNVWGDVNSAGRYLVPKDTRLPELISLSFGPATLRDRETALDWSKLRLEVKVSRYDKSRRLVDVASFRYRYDEPEPVEMFEYDLQNNDIVTLQVKRKPAFIDYVRVVAPIITTVATGILIIDRLR